MDIPTFSVVVPLYNHEKYIRAALRSVVEQTCQPYELIVVDDGSTDAGYDVACRTLEGIPYARVLRQDNSGAHNAINRAIEMATGSHIAILNSDDLFKTYKLERCLRLLHRHPETGLIFGRVEIIDSDNHFVENNETTRWLDRCYEYLYRCNNLGVALINENFGVTTSNFVLRRDLWTRAGGFQNLRYCHDLDFLMAVSCYSNILFDKHGGPHISYRVHPQNTIKETLDKVRLEIAAVIACAFKGDALHFADDVFECYAHEIENILRNKGLAEKVASLIPFCPRFESRGRLYAQISGNRDHLAVTNDHSTTLPVQKSARRNARQSADFDNKKEGRSPSDQIRSGENSIESRTSVNSFDVRQKPIVAAIELSNFDKGGVEKVVLDCAVAFRECGIEPIVVSAGEVGHLGSIARDMGIETVKLPAEETMSFYEKILRERNVDIAMSHFSYTGYELFRKLNIPNITFIHNIYAMLRGAALDSFLKADAYVDRYISVSALATEYVVSKYGFDSKKITTIPNGLIISEHEKKMQSESVDRSQFGISDDDYMFLNVASYNLHKAHYLMADAMRIIRNVRKDIKILCLGNTIFQPHIDELSEYIKASGLQDHIVMPGYFDDVAPFHMASDAFLLPSFIEGWSIAMNEAMFYGKPMILSEVGGAPEVIVDSDIGLLVPNEYGSVVNLDSYELDRIAYQQRRFSTAPYLANAMMNFADNKAYWQKKGLVSRRKVIDDFDFSKVVRRYAQICRDVLSCED